MSEISIMYKTGREYHGDIVDTRLCVKKDGKILYHSKGKVFMNLSTSETQAKFYALSSDGCMMVFLQNNPKENRQEYLMLDFSQEKIYNLGFFQDKQMLELIRGIDKLNSEELVSKLETKGKNSSEPRRDSFSKNFFEIIGINGWKEHLVQCK